MITPALAGEVLAGYGIAVPPPVAERVAAYANILIQWNQKVSLTSVRRPREILERHFGESFFAAAAVPIRKGRLADVGTGAGFPGLALKLLCPELSVVLLEPHLKKTVFLAEVVRRLGLRDVEILRSRFEDLRPEHVTADYITSRAFGDYEGLVGWAARSLVLGGHLVLWLGSEDATMIAERREFSWRSPIPLPKSRERVLLIGQQGRDKQAA